MMPLRALLCGVWLLAALVAGPARAQRPPLGGALHRVYLGPGRAGPPDAVVYVPAGFDARPRLAIIVYLHGFYNCAENVLRDEDQPCAPGGAARRAHALARQLEESGRSALLLCPETAFDRRSGRPGILGQRGGLRLLLGAALRQLAPRLGRRSLADVGHVVVVAHSAGYQAAAAVLRRGGVPVQEVYLLDALYGGVSTFADWIRADLRAFQGPRPARRFVCIATRGGGTLRQAESLRRRVRRWLPGPPAGLLFVRARVAHAALPRHYFGWLLGQSGLPPRRRLA